jgi:hypothetical protein
MSASIAERIRDVADELDRRLSPWVRGHPPAAQHDSEKLRALAAELEEKAEEMRGWPKNNLVGWLNIPKEWADWLAKPKLSP